jgi:hypothetical protein
LIEKLNAVPAPLPDQVLQAQQDGDAFALSQSLPDDWASKRPEQLSPGQFVEVTRLIFGDNSNASPSDVDLGRKVWRKLKHGI